MVPSTSNYWPYHTDLLVFCLKFRLSPVCEYLKYCYKLSNDYWAVPEKIQTSGFEEIFRFVTLSYGNFGRSLTLGNSMKLCCTLWQFQAQKWRLLEIQHYFFLIILEIPLFFSWLLEFPYAYIHIYIHRYIDT